MNKVEMFETEEQKKVRLIKEKEERAKYRKEMKTYEKLGALKFQKVVFSIEKLKFKILKKVSPNFITYFDKYINWQKRRKIKKINKSLTRRDRIKEKCPCMINFYDKISSFTEKRKELKQEKMAKVRNKIQLYNPKLINFYDKYLKLEKPLDGLSKEEQIKMIKESSKFSKMYFRKEFYQEKNINYHIDAKRPTDIYGYLEWNKKIHVRGLIKDFIALPILSVGTILGFPFALPLLIFEVFSTAINFECVNIQNYSMCRYKITEKLLKEQENKHVKDMIDNHNEASKLIYNSISRQDELPSFSEIIDNATDINQIRQLRDLLKKTQEERIVEMNRGKKL